MTRVAVWVIVFAVHGSAQFVCWAIAESQSPLPFFRVAADVLTFPLLFVAGPASDLWFWPLFVLNSAVWASLALVALAFTRRGNAAASGQSSNERR
jgi:hypothetical protein